MFFAFEFAELILSLQFAIALYCSILEHLDDLFYPLQEFEALFILQKIRRLIKRTPRYL